MKSIAIVGRLPAISFAELESLLGEKVVEPFGSNSMLIDIDTADIPFDRLGGTIRLARILALLDVKNWREAEAYLVKTVKEHAHYIPGKLVFGLSVFGFDAKREQVARTALLMKKAIKSTGKSVRMVPHSDEALGSASVLHNKLTGQNGWELLVVSDGKITYLAQTTNIQDIESYAARDQARPKRDARVGMLPPKLAQTIVNLASGQVGSKIEDRGSWIGDRGSRIEEASSVLSPQSPVLLDPFCGTGVVLQEALLMGYEVYGTDLEPRMVEYTKTNLTWLEQFFEASDIQDLRSRISLGVGDASSHHWQTAPDFVASETYLGPPLTALPDPQKFKQIVHDISRLHNKFLQNIGSQLKPGARLCLAVPAWISDKPYPSASRLDEAQGETEQRSKPYTRYGARATQVSTQRFAKNTSSANGFSGRQAGAARYVWHLSTLDKLQQLGYTRIQFKFANSDQLIYHRDGQLVARELVVLERL